MNRRKNLHENRDLSRLACLLRLDQRPPVLWADHPTVSRPVEFTAACRPEAPDWCASLISELAQQPVCVLED